MLDKIRNALLVIVICLSLILVGFVVYNKLVPIEHSKIVTELEGPTNE